MTLTLPDVVTFIAVFLFWLVTAFLLSHRAGYRAPNAFLAAFLVSKSLCVLNGLFFRFTDQLVSSGEAR
jgi:hypothetical protein